LYVSSDTSCVSSSDKVLEFCGSDPSFFSSLVAGISNFSSCLSSSLFIFSGLYSSLSVLFISTKSADLPEESSSHSFFSLLVTGISDSSSLISSLSHSHSGL
jgi:hypothetical protein